MEMFDEDLMSMVNYTDETAPQQMPVMECHEERKAEAKEAEAPCMVYPKKERDFLDKLFDMMKWLLICGSICMLMWWFEANGLMAMEAAYPCILGSAVIGAAGAGWSAK